MDTVFQVYLPQPTILKNSIYTINPTTPAENNFTTQSLFLFKNIIEFCCQEHKHFSGLFKAVPHLKLVSTTISTFSFFRWMTFKEQRDNPDS